MTPDELVHHCRSAGVELSAHGDRLTFRAPAGALDAPLRSALSANKVAVIRLLVAACPSCRRTYRPEDAAARRCWHCSDRVCGSCGRPTGSPFFGTCLVCELTKGEP